MLLSNDRRANSTPLYDDDPSIFNPSLSFYHFSPTISEHNHAQLAHLLLPQPQLLTANTNLVTEVFNEMAVSDRTMPIAEKQNPEQKRSVKRDRHSKITTAQGIRDRRMRLSLEVARDFFGLQDLRGDDKPSKTIRWLLNQCKGPIKDLARDKEVKTKQKSDGGGGGAGAGGSAKSVSSTSECEVISGIEEISNARDCEGKVPEKKALTNRRKRQPRKTKFPTIGRESREKARARARERTREKITARRLTLFSSPSETGEESGISHSHEMKSAIAEMAVNKEPSSNLLGLQRPNTNSIEERLMITSNSSLPSIFCFQHENAITQGLVCSNNNHHNNSNCNNNNNNIPCFENWDFDSIRTHYCAMSNSYPSTGNIQDRISTSVFLTTSEIHPPCHFSDVSNVGKPWEGYNC